MAMFSFQAISRRHIQPWYPSPTPIYEAGAAVLKIASRKSWESSAALSEQQKKFFDINVDEMLELSKVTEKPDETGQMNIGNKVTKDIKLMVKGIEEPGTSSSFTATQWDQWLAESAI
ncbi:hypothetical protein BJX61DRAFT_538082 [Aspergillus egyptiacus]|nr:hypothetical protein BJX61DRAFT_538082 [Aspergillus egyptiacus]